MDLANIESALQSTGLVSRGGFYPEPDDAVLPLANGTPVGTLILVGNVGNAMWKAFQQANSCSSNPISLDIWTRKVLTPLAKQWHADVWFPFDGPPYLPFQRWAQRAEPVAPSPIGPLIHPEYGLWHAYRGALAFSDAIELIPLVPYPSPCQNCANRPCLSACPAGALAPNRYDFNACHAHISHEVGTDCMHSGCLARRACPVGRSFMYPPEQTRFHMDAFLRNARLHNSK